MTSYYFYAYSCIHTHFMCINILNLYTILYSYTHILYYELHYTHTHYTVHYNVHYTIHTTIYSYALYILIHIIHTYRTIAEMKAFTEANLIRAKIIQTERDRIFGTTSNTTSTNKHKHKHKHDNDDSDDSKHKNKYKRKHKIKQIRNATYNTIIKDIVIPYNGLYLKELASKLSLKLYDIKHRLENLGT